MSSLRPPDDDAADAPLLVQLARLRWRADALDEWRNGTRFQPGVDTRISALEAKVDGMMRSEEIADAVVEQLRADRRLGWTTVQKLAAFAVGLIVLLGNMKSLGLPL